MGMVYPIRLILMMIMTGCQIVKMPSQKILRSSLIPMEMAKETIKTLTMMGTAIVILMNYLREQIPKIQMRTLRIVIMMDYQTL